MTIFARTLLALFLIAPLNNACYCEEQTFVSLKFDKANLRSGPGRNYPIRLQYNQKHRPFKLISKFENWRRIEDVGGTRGWMHKTLLSDAPCILVVKNKYLKSSRFKRKGELILFRRPDETSYPITRIELTSAAKIQKCRGNWCEIKAGHSIGWALKTNMWPNPDKLIK